MRLKYSIYCIYFIFFSGTFLHAQSKKNSFTQNKTIDSLQFVLKNAKHDTTRVKVLVAMNQYGQLGNGNNANQSSPIQIGTNNKWICVAAGNNHSFGLQSNGTLSTWGYNSNGQLGNGTTTNQNSPMQIGTDNNWVNSAAGNAYTVGLKSDRNNFCAVGYNNNGQLGDNSVIDKNNFVCNTNNGMSTEINNMQKSNSEIIIYPNPTNGIVNILLNGPITNTSIKLYNIAGEKIKETIKSSEYIMELDLTEQPNGIYFLEINQNKIISRTKLIKSN